MRKKSAKNLTRQNRTPLGVPSGDEPLLFAAKNYCLKLLSIRARAKRELVDRLKEKKYTDGIIDSAVRDLSSVGLIDDKAFAHHWIARQIENNCGKMRMIFELRQKGIAENIISAEIESALNNYNETKAAETEAKKFTTIYKNAASDALARRLSGHLARKGFSEDIIQNILDRYDHE